MTRLPEVEVERTRERLIAKREGRSGRASRCRRVKGGVAVLQVWHAPLQDSRTRPRPTWLSRGSWAFQVRQDVTHQVRLAGLASFPTARLERGCGSLLPVAADRGRAALLGNAMPVAKEIPILLAGLKSSNKGILV